MAGPREGWVPLIGGRGTLRAIIELLLLRPASGLFIAGRCALLAPG
jgi:hypothetical protein